MKVGTSQVVDPPTGWLQLKPPQSRRLFVDVLKVLDQFLPVPLYPPSVRAWLDKVVGAEYSDIDFQQLCYESDPVWAVIDDLTHPEWLARLAAQTFRAEVARLLARLTWRRNHRLQTGDTDDHLRDQSLVVRRGLKHYAALLWPGEMRGTPAPVEPLNLTSLLREPSFRLATPSFASSGIVFADARRDYVMAFERDLIRLFNNDIGSWGCRGAGDEDAEESDTEGEAKLLAQTADMARDLACLGDGEAPIGSDGTVSDDEAQPERVRSVVKSWASSTGKLAQRCRALPIISKLVAVLSRPQEQMPPPSTEHLAALVLGGLAAFHGVPVVDALNLSINGTEERGRLAESGAPAPGYLSCEPVPHYTVALGCDYSPDLDGRYTQVQFLSLPLPSGLAAIVTELARRAGGPTTLRSLLGSEALDTFLSEFAKITSVDVDDIRYRSLHRAYDYCATISAAVPLPLVMILAGRPMVDWRSSTNYMSATYAGLGAAHRTILESLHHSADTRLDLCAATLSPPEAVFGAPAPSWEDEVARFAGLVTTATAHAELLALSQFFLKLLGARHRSSHIHLGGAYRPFPSPHFRFADKTAIEQTSHWISALPAMGNLVQVAFDLGERGRDVAYPKLGGKPVIWSGMAPTDRKKLERYARAESDGKSPRRSFFAALSAAGAGEAPLKNLLGHGLDQNLSFAHHPIYSQGYLMLGNRAILESMPGMPALDLAIEELTEKLRSFPVTTAMPSASKVRIADEKGVGLDLGHAQNTQRADHQIALAVITGLQRQAAMYQDSRSQRFDQSILAAELILVLGSEEAVRRLGPYWNGYCFAIPVASHATDPARLIIIAPIGQPGGQLGLLPIEIGRDDPAAASRICRAAERVQAHLEKRIPKTNQENHPAVLAGLNLFSDYTFGKPQLSGALKECFRLGLEAGVDVGADRDPTLSRIYEAFCGSAADHASKALANHLLASLKGTHLHPVEHFSIPDLLADFWPLQSTTGVPWVDPTAPAQRRRKSWTLEKAFEDATLEAHGNQGPFSRILVPGWRFLPNQVITALGCHMPNPSRSKIAKWIQKHRIFFPREQSRFWPGKWAAIRLDVARLLPPNLLASLPHAPPRDSDDLISHVQQTCPQPSEAADVLAAVSSACWRVLSNPEREKLATRQAAWVMSRMWKKGLAVAAKALRLLRPAEMAAFLIEVDAELERTRLSPSERREARVMIVMGLLMGMRIEEVCRAFVGDLEEGRILQIYGGKTGAARRAASLDLFGDTPEAAPLKAEVIAYFVAQRDRPAKSTLWPALAESYPRKRGERIAHGRRKMPSPDTMATRFDGLLDNAFRQFCLKAGRPPATEEVAAGAMTFHTLRHAAAFRLTQYAFTVHFWHGNFYAILGTISIQFGHVCMQTTQCGYVGTASIAVKMPPLPISRQNQPSIGVRERHRERSDTRASDDAAEVHPGDVDSGV